MKPNNRKTVYERMFYLSLILVLAVFCIVFMLRTMNLGEALRKSADENEKLAGEYTALNRKLTMSQARIADLRDTMPGLHDKAVAEFRRLGLENPQEDIIEDLGSREELMPFEGVFGARPSFYNEVRMYVLNARWAFASFNDGHSTGDRLYAYRVSDGGKISWTVLDTFMSRISTSGTPSE